jgi:hypothetical protein
VKRAAAITRWALLTLVRHGWTLTDAGRAALEGAKP